MASASYKPKPTPTYLTLNYTIVPDQPIYLVDVDGTLLKAGEDPNSISTVHQLNNGLVEFLKNKPNVFLFTKMTGESVRNSLNNQETKLFKNNLTLRYILCEELKKNKINIMGIITPGDISINPPNPGKHYINYLYGLEQNLSTDYSFDEMFNSVHKNEMYNMSKNYFVSKNIMNDIIFIDDEIEQIFAVGLQKLVHDSIRIPSVLKLIHVDVMSMQNSEYFNKEGSTDLITVVGNYLSSLNEKVKNNKNQEFKNIVKNFSGQLNDQAIKAFKHVCKELNIDISDIDLKIKSPFARSAQTVDTERPLYAQQFNNEQGARALANRPPPAQPASASKPKPFPLSPSDEKTIGASASANTPYGQPSEKWTQTDIQQLLDLMQTSKITNIPINELIGSSGTRSPVILKYQNSPDNQTSQDPSIWSKKQLEGLFELQQMSEALNEPVPIQDLRGTNGIPPLIQKYIKLLQVSLPDTPTDELPCKACTFLNLKNRNFCEVCGTKLKGGGGKKRKTKTKSKSKNNKTSNKTKKHTKSRISRKYHNKKH
jgi:hypothetical protein